MKPTNTDFAVAFSGLRTQARVHGVDPNTPEMRAFLVNTANVMAQQHAETRQAMKVVHAGLKEVCDEL